MKRNNFAVLAAALALGLAAALASAAMDDAGPTSGQSAGMTGQTSQKDAQTVISKWPAKTKTAAQALIQKYGQPDTVSNRMLAWNNKDDWQAVAVYRESFKKSLGLSQDNFIENRISYDVPTDKTSELKKFDHALVIDHPKGTLASRGDSEKTNILALNLANEIVTGKRDAASAKDFMQKTQSEAMAGKSSPYTDKLMFTPSSSNQGGSSAPSQAAPSGSQPSTQPQQSAPQNAPPSGY